MFKNQRLNVDKNVHYVRYSIAYLCYATTKFSKISHKNMVLNCSPCCWGCVSKNLAFIPSECIFIKCVVYI